MSGQTQGTYARRTARVTTCTTTGLLGRRERALLLAPLLAASLVSAGGPVDAQSGAQRPLSAGTIVVAFRHAGLAIEHVQRQSVGGNPSPGGPPPTEREAWGFTVRGQIHGDGRILLYATTRGRDMKVAWFRRVGACILVRRNAIVWLDHGLASFAARFHRALAGV